MSGLRIYRVIVAIVLATPVFVSAEEQTPKTLAEAKAEFAKADKALNEAWAAAKKALPESEFAELQVKQRNWVKYRDDLAARSEQGQRRTGR